MSTFDTTRTEALYVLQDTKKWGEYSGETACPSSGWFSCLAITPQMLDTLDDVDLELVESLVVDPESLVGYFLLQENDEGEVTSQRFETSAELVHLFEQLETEYDAWVDNVLDAAVDSLRALEVTE